MSVRRLRASVVAAVALAALTSRSAWAGPCDDRELAPCFDADTLWVRPGPSPFVGVGGTETLAPATVGFGLVTTYLSRPVTLTLPSPGPRGGAVYAVDNQINASFLFAYGLTSRLELDLVMPLTLFQNGAGTQPITGGSALRDTATRDFRFGFSYALVPRARVMEQVAPKAPGMAPGRAWALTARFELAVPTGDEAQFAGGPTATFVPSVAADYRRGRWYAAGEFGARIRPTTGLAGARIGTQLVLGVGVGAHLLPRELLSVGLEARVLPGFAAQGTPTQGPQGLTVAVDGGIVAPAEWMLTARTAPFFGGDVAFQLGGGGPIPFRELPITVPRYRFVLSIVYAPAARDSDGDGVPDRDDRCPSVPGVRASEDGAGCPPKPPAAVPRLLVPPLEAPPAAASPSSPTPAPAPPSPYDP
jgi:hypothetical protein